MLGEKYRKRRHDVQARKGEGTADAQAARQRCGGAARGEFRFVGFLDRPCGAFIEVPTRLGRRQAVRRTPQKAHAKPLLELRDRLGNGGLADTQLLCRAGE